MPDVRGYGVNRLVIERPGGNRMVVAIEDAEHLATTVGRLAPTVPADAVWWVEPAQQ